MPSPAEAPLPAGQRYEGEARRWEETGEMQASGTNQYAYLILSSWLLSDGARREGVSERLLRYSKAAQAALNRSQGSEWYDKLLNTRDYCSVCGETFRIENLSLCTHCETMLGYCHSNGGGSAPNGNPLCPRCRVGEIVG